MQLGMIGLGRMGANMVLRLMHAGHECIVYDLDADVVHGLAAQGAVGAGDLDEFIGKLDKPRNVWIMVPAAFVDSTIARSVEAARQGRHDHRRWQQLLPRRHTSRRGAGGPGHPLRRRRHQWRCLRARPRLLPHDRRRREAVQRLEPVFDALGARHRHRPPNGRSRRRADPGRARLPPLWSVRRGPLREDGPQRHRVRDHGRVRGGTRHPRTSGRRLARTRQGRRDRAAATSGVLQVRPRHPCDRGVVAAGVGGRARGSSTSRPMRWWSRPISKSSPGECPTRARVGGLHRLRSRSACRRTCSPRRCTSGLLPRATRTSPTSCSPPCESSSAGTSRRSSGERA